MRIAVGVDGNTIAGHFGHSGDFQVFTVEDNKVTSAEIFSNPGHTATMNPADFVVTLEVDAAIGGTIGQHALDTLTDANIEGVFGADGMDARKAVEAYLAGELKHNTETGVLAPGEPCC
ncbi:MAG: NifB/NifX family molybdenum-iron cluster-binding protein [Eubacteriales bacterium]|nr:NifB/NifX family molybdenum-iron cluster-binding protein [Eubacteriales bacterium]MDD4541770.1 NifB/NifX family molybdenum-iron cluster-binding protein [Eubacteriales bacterium]